MTEIIFSAKGVALYGITLADNVRSPMPMFRKHCHKNCKDDEGKWHLLTDIPLNQKIDSGERIVTILWHELSSTEKENLGKKVSESSPKQQRVAESLSKLEEVKVEEQVWKHQVQPFVLYNRCRRRHSCAAARATLPLVTLGIRVDIFFI